MRLLDALDLQENTRLAFVGAGGKSGAMFRLAREWVAQTGKGILLTASTHLAVAQLALADTHLVVNYMAEVEALADGSPSGVFLLTGPIGEDGRTAGLSFDLLAVVNVLAESWGTPLLIEADGARSRSLKAPAAHEPAIPPFVSDVVVSAGMQGIGKPLDSDWVHRPEVFATLSGLEAGQLVTLEALMKVLLHPEGGLKGIPLRSRRSILLNQCDTPELASIARQAANALLSGYRQVIVASLMDTVQPVQAVLRPVAGVVLAAGGSTRMGQPKQLLEWRGKPFVSCVAQTALEAGLSPVVVVTGAHAQAVAGALDGLAVKVVENQFWAQGQASSVRIGIHALPEETGAAFFLLADQPQVPATLIHALLEAYAATLAPVVAPLVDGQRGNPVLFDRSVFPALLALKGDAGGRQVFSRYPPHYVPWLDASAGLDVDTPEDYERLKKG